MKILVLFILTISFAVFAKPNINYKYIPKDVNLIGYVSTKSLTKSKYFKKVLKTKDGKEALKNLKKFGINIKKLGSIFFYLNTDKLMLAPKNKIDMKDIDYTVVLSGISLEKALKLSIKDKELLASTKKYKGINIYKNLKAEKDEIEAVSFLNKDTLLGSFSGVKKSIDTLKNKSNFKSEAIIKSLSSQLGNPDLFLFNIINQKQKELINTLAEKNKVNPMVAMLGIIPISKSVKSLGFSLKLKKDIITMGIFIEADKPSVKTFITALNTQFKNFKPMIMQQIDSYAMMLGKDGAKELKAIVNSLKISQKKNLGIISFKINLKNVIKIIEKNKKKNGNDNPMLRMMNKREK